MSKILEKIEEKMAVIELLMNAQEHINSPLKVAEAIHSLSMYWAHVPDSDKDYIECASEALKNQTEWLV
jgi:hypothetical protein